MNRLGIAARIWASLGLFLLGAIVAIAVGQVQSRVSEARLISTSEALFPAADRSQEAEAAVQRMAKGFQDAVLTEDTSALEAARKEAQAASGALTAVAALPSLGADRSQALRALAAQVTSVAAVAEGAYAPMVTAGGNLTDAMMDKSRVAAEQMDKLKAAMKKQREASAADLQGEIGRAVSDSVRQRWMLLVTFAVAFAIAAAVMFITIRKSIIRPFSAVADELMQGSAKVATASAEVRSSSQTLSQGATEQAASLQQTSASMEEMASMTRRNAENSQTAAGLMADVDAQVRASNGALGNMVTSMDAIQESSQQVAKIIKTIDEIAFQTNILALNAAVEAARAGEAGMGFAVVADEVRNLAQRSAQAARDTAGLIEASVVKSKAGSAMVGQVAASISAITESVSKVKTLVEEVSVASRQQSQGIDQVSQAIAQMEKVTQNTAATAEECAAASEELSTQAETALSVVDRMKGLVTGQRAPASQAAPAGESQARTYREAA